MTGTGHPTGAVRALLRAEGVAVALVMAVVAWRLGPPWWLVVAVLAAPDLALAGYAAGPRTGAALYNAAHSYLGPALAAGAWLVLGGGALAAIAALWALHIGADRALGYGLKYPTAFGDTHLGRVGRA
jgi:hypothetical protein